MKRRHYLWLFTITGLCLICASAVASPPMFNYQGTLNDSAGKPVTGDKKMVFKIYPALDTPLANALWTSAEMTVKVTNGVFSVNLGENPVFPANLFSEDNRYLGVSIEGSELSRQKLMSVPYALQAGTVANATHAASADNANYAVKAGLADKATNADNAVKAAQADNATHATTADSLTGVTKMPYKARAFRNTLQRFPPKGVMTKVQFDQKSYDPNNNFDNVTNFRYTVPVNGFYLINAKLRYRHLTGKLVWSALEVNKNGGTLDSVVDSDENAGLGGYQLETVLSDIYQLNQGDSIEIFGGIDTNDGSTANIGTEPFEINSFSIHLMSQ